MSGGRGAHPIRQVTVKALVAKNKSRLGIQVKRGRKGV